MTRDATCCPYCAVGGVAALRDSRTHPHTPFTNTHHSTNNCLHPGVWVPRLCPQDPEGVDRPSWSTGGHWSGVDRYPRAPPLLFTGAPMLHYFPRASNITSHAGGEILQDGNIGWSASEVRVWRRWSRICCARCMNIKAKSVILP